METNNPQTTNELNFQRSAIAPVGMVAVASMKTSWKKNQPATPRAKITMFIIIVWAAFFARVKPVSTRAKPACMNSTRMPPSISQVMLIDVRFFSTCDATSSAEGLSFADGAFDVSWIRLLTWVPVLDPSLSPLAAIAAPPSTPTSTSDAMPITSQRPRRVPNPAADAPERRRYRPYMTGSNSASVNTDISTGGADMGLPSLQGRRDRT